MKKLFSIFLVILMLLSAVTPVLAESATEIIYLSESMTEQEFREHIQDSFFPGLSDFQSVNGTEIHEKGYYYTFIPSTPDNIIQLGYAIADSGYTWKQSSSLKKNAWVSNGYFDLTFFEGMAYNSAEYRQAYEYYIPRVFAGMWACRYDNPADFDRCNNTVTVDLSIRTDGNIITDFDVYAVMEDHAYYRDSLVKARDNEITQIVAEANKKSSQFEAVLYVHDYLINTAEYDFRDCALKEDYSAREEFFYAHSSFGVLNRGLGVCESYSKAFKIICDRMNNGPECALITSNTHMWNIVQLGGKWYCLDATWDDQGDGGISDTYFLCEDPDMVDGAKTDHVPLTKFGFLPQYASSRYHNHTTRYVAQVNATNTANGVSAHYRCDGCGMYFTDKAAKHRTTLEQLTIAKLEHSLKYVPKVNATETATGIKEHYKCNGCGKLFTDATGKTETTLKNLTIAALGVTFSKPTITAGNTTSGVKVSWGAVSKAEKYYVYRRTNSKNAWKKIKETKNTAYIDTTVSSGSQYQYAVRAVQGSATSGYSNTVTIKFLAATKVTAKNATMGITASWSKITGASGYIVYRRQKTSSGWGDWNKLTTVKSLSYTDKTASAGKDYQYMVKAYSGSDTASWRASSTLRRLAITSVKTAVYGNYLKTTWSKATGAGYYVVYRSQLSGNKWSSWKKVATIKTTSYVDKSTKSRVAYRYQVCARYDVSASAYKVGGAITKLTAPTVTASVSGKNIVAKWGKITGASGYTVYRRQKTSLGWSSWMNLGNQKSLSYTDKKATVGVQYQYAVKAYSGSVKSDLKTSAVVCVLSTPKATITNKEGGIQVSWKKITGADSYVVYRSYLKSGKWTSWKKVATATGASALDKTTSSGTTYRYCVRAVLGTNKSGYQASSSLKYLATPDVKVAVGDSQIKATWGKITGASGYTVYRRQKTSSGWSSWKNLGNQKSLSYTDKKATGSVEYQYTVKAYSGSAKSAIKPSATVCTLATPNVTVANTLEAIVAQWSKVSGATAYRVYRRELSGSTWSTWRQLGVTTELSHTDTTFAKNKTYQYTARAVAGTLTSGYKASASIQFVEAPREILVPIDERLYWYKVEGATAYYIYRRTWEDGKPSTEWKKIGEAGAGDNEYEDKTAQSGNRYQYGVCAVKGTSTSALREGGAYYYLAQPDFQLFSLNGTVNINIKPVNGVTAYDIYKDDGSGWKTIMIGSQTFYTDTDVVVGKTYRYFVIGKRGNMNTTPSIIKSIVVR